MAKTQTLVRFHNGSSLDALKCAYLFEKIDLEEKKNPNNPERARLPDKIRSLKQSVSSIDLSQYQETLTINDFEKFAKERYLRVRIWRQKTHKSKFYLEFESELNEQEALKFRNLDLFSRTFDKFKNPDFKGIALILDIEKFAKNREYDAGNDRVQKRLMTIFQALVTELYPKLQGESFNRKVQSFEALWGEDCVNLSDFPRFYKLFGVGIQAWSRVTKPNRETYCVKQFDTVYKNKVRIELEDFTENDAIPIRTLVWYIYDDKVLNYFSCPNKKCFYGTDRYYNYQRHLLNCRDTPLVKYKQVKNQKPDDKIIRELVEEKILPSTNFKNMHFATFDIGEFTLYILKNDYIVYVFEISTYLSSCI